MNIRKLNHIHHRFLFLKAWYFLVPAVIFGLLAVHSLRANYSTMVKLRDAVYAADQQNGDVEGALNKLRSHVYGHMNTNLVSGNNSIRPPIQLKARYDRLVASQQGGIKATNDQVAAQGAQICGAQFPAAGFNAPRVACVQEYVRTHASVASQAVPDQLYKFDFVSPGWSPDLAGVSIVASVIFLVLFIARWLIERHMRKRLHH